MRPPDALSLLLAPGLNSAPAAEMPDLSKVDRRITKRPAYVAKEPLRGLALFWMCTHLNVVGNKP